MNGSSVSEGTGSPRQSAVASRWLPTWSTVWGYVSTERVVLLSAMLVVWVVLMRVLQASGSLSGSYDLSLLLSASYLIVPVTLLALGQMFVLVTGKGNIDLSAGGMVSIGSMVLGYTVGQWDWPAAIGILVAVAACAALGALNGLLAAHLGIPALIATLATSYAFTAVAVLMSPDNPISTPSVTSMSSALAKDVYVFGPERPPVPSLVLWLLIPVVLLTWVAFNRTPFGRRLYGVGVNDSAARFVGIPPKRVRFQAFVCSGLLAGAAAVAMTATYATASPTAGANLVFPAIAVALLGGVAFTGGAGRVGAVALAGVLVVFIHSGLLIIFDGIFGDVYYLLVLGLLLIVAAILNDVLTRRFSGS